MMSKFAFYTVGNRGTVRQTGKYNPERACEALYQSMIGIGTDEAAVIETVCSHTFEQRQEIKQMYQQKYSKNLEKELDSELSFSFSKTVLALMKHPEEYIIECIHHAISQKSKASQILKQLQKIYKKVSISSDDFTLLSLLCPRSNAEVDAIKILYKQRYRSELEDDIGFDLSDELRSLIVDMISGGREDGETELEKVWEDAANLHGASFVPQGEICGTKERILQQILNSRSYDHLRQLFSAYKEVSNKSIEEYIESTELSSDLKEAYMAICKILRSEPEFYAERLKDAIQGIGTDDETLISIVVLRSEIDLIDIQEIYERNYGISLAKDVAGDTSGDYKNIMMKILTIPNDDDGTNEAEDAEEEGEEQADEITITAAALSEDKEEEDDNEELEADRVSEEVAKVTQQVEVAKAPQQVEVDKEPQQVEEAKATQQVKESVEEVRVEEEEATCTTPVPETADPTELCDPPIAIEEAEVHEGAEKDEENEVEKSDEEKTVVETMGESDGGGNDEVAVGVSGG